MIKVLVLVASTSFQACLCLTEAHLLADLSSLAFVSIPNSRPLTSQSVACLDQIFTLASVLHFRVYLFRLLVTTVLALCLVNLLLSSKVTLPCHLSTSLTILVLPSGFKSLLPYIFLVE